MHEFVPRALWCWLAVASLGLPAETKAAVDPNSVRMLKRPLGAVELTWGDATPSGYCIARAGVAPPTTPIGGTAALMFTETPPAPTPIWYYAVDESTSCLLGGCAPADALTCAARSVFSSNDAPGSSSTTDSYPACGLFDLTGSEYVYRFVPSQDLIVSLALSGLSADLDIVVLEERGSGCDPASCIAAGDTMLSFDAFLGSTYYVVVDGRAGATSDFTLGIGCSGTRCAPTTPALRCDTTTPGNNGGSGSTLEIDDYRPCSLSGLSGPELAYSFTPATDTLARFTLASTTADLDLVLLEETGSGCETTSCLASADASLSLPVTAGTTYYLVIDGRAGATSDYDLTVTCLDAPPASCTPASVLSCGAPIVGRTDDPGSTDAIDSYPCGGGDESGPEYAFSFRASGTGDVSFRLSPSTSGSTDVFVLSAPTGCSASSCVAADDAEVTLPVVAGNEYYVVVDGPAAAAYSVRAVCDFAPGVCEPTVPLRCGDILFGDTASGSATDVNDTYPCSPHDMSGPEVTYEFVPPDPTNDYVVTMSMELTTDELDLFVLRNEGTGCDPASCLEWGDNEVAFTAEASRQYFLTVDGRAGAASGYRVLVHCSPAPGACSPAASVACGDVLRGRSNGAPGSTDVIDAYPFCPPIEFDESGPEYTNRFDATRDGSVTVSLRALMGGIAHLHVLEDLGTGCDATNCVAKGTTMVSFDALAGHTYYIITDGFRGDVATFDLSVSCP